MLDHDILQKLVETGQLTTLRRGERLSPTRLGGEMAIVVIAGLAGIESHLDSVRRQIHAFAFPRELVCLEPFEAMPDLAVTAMIETRLCRFRSPRLSPSLEDRPPDGVQVRLANALQCERLAFLKRQAVHAATLGRLSGEERVATLLLEIALVNGRRRGTETVFDLAMTRSDMADYLDLNADTLSRVLSRLKTTQTLNLDGRTEARTPNLEAISQLTPLASAVRISRPRAL